VTGVVDVEVWKPIGGWHGWQKMARYAIGNTHWGSDRDFVRTEIRKRRAQQTLDDSRVRVRDAGEAGALAYRHAKSIAS
jgi:hypothetical protein